MEDLNAVNKLIKTTREDNERALNETISALDHEESLINARLEELNRKKCHFADLYSNPDATGDDLLEINAGGKVVVAKRSVLTQIQGTKYEALFSGRWDKKLQRDTHGRIFLDVNPSAFCAIVDHLNEMSISCEDNPPSPPSVDNELSDILQHQLEMFCLVSGCNIPPESNIIKKSQHWITILEWLKEADDHVALVTPYDVPRRSYDFERESVPLPLPSTHAPPQWKEILPKSFCHSEGGHYTYQQLTSNQEVMNELEDTTITPSSIPQIRTQYRESRLTEALNILPHTILNNVRLYEVTYEGPTYGLIMISNSGRLIVKSHQTDDNLLFPTRVGAIIVGANGFLFPLGMPFRTALNYMKEQMKKPPVYVIFADDEDFISYFVEDFEPAVRNRKRKRDIADTDLTNMLSNTKGTKDLSYNDTPVTKNSAIIHALLSTQKFVLLYRGSSDGFENESFHLRCDTKGSTITIIETMCGKVIGGYSNTSWGCLASGEMTTYQTATEAFLFALSGGCISSPYKIPLDMNVHNAEKFAIYNDEKYGPAFGFGHDLERDNSIVKFNPGCTYCQGPFKGEFEVKEMEVYQVIRLPPSAMKEVTEFSDAMNKAIIKKKLSLSQANSEVVQLENSFNEEQTFIENLSIVDANDVVTLNVRGTTMTTTRSTLCTAEESVLAQQFDNSKWTEQGASGTRVANWSPDEVSTWARSIVGLSEDVGMILNKNEITGIELLALGRDDMNNLGITRVGSIALLLKEIEKLEKSNQEIVTLIEHSPYCFGKILDYLRLKHHHSLGLLTKESSLPKVRESEQTRFEKVVQYYFPGDCSKFILG